jgi:hypothetical protein
VKWRSHLGVDVLDESCGMACGASKPGQDRGRHAELLPTREPAATAHRTTVCGDRVAASVDVPDTIRRQYGVAELGAQRLPHRSRRIRCIEHGPRMARRGNDHERPRRALPVQRNVFLAVVGHEPPERELLDSSQAPRSKECGDSIQGLGRKRPAATLDRGCLKLEQIGSQCLSWPGSGVENPLSA